jgi:hypothetical protein
MIVQPSGSFPKSDGVHLLVTQLVALEELKVLTLKTVLLHEHIFSCILRSVMEWWLMDIVDIPRRHDAS